jgi:hypothetical protein
MSENMYDDPLSFQMFDSEEDLTSEDMETFDSYEVLEVISIKFH